MTNTYVRRGRAPALGGVAEGTRVVAMSDEDAKNLDRDQALRCVLVSVIQVCNSSEFPEPRVKSYAMSWCFALSSTSVETDLTKTANPEDGLAFVWKWIQDLSPAGMLAFLRETPNCRECAFFEFCRTGTGLSATSHFGRAFLQPGPDVRSGIPQVSAGRRSYSAGRAHVSHGQRTR